MWYQRTITLSEKPRGFHLITDEIIDKLSGLPPVETVCCICCYYIPRPR